MRRIVITATLLSGFGIAAIADPVETLSSESLDQVTAGAFGAFGRTCLSLGACSISPSSPVLGGGIFGGCAFGGDDCSSSSSSATASDGEAATLYNNFPNFPIPVQTQDLPDLPGPNQ